MIKSEVTNNYLVLPKYKKTSQNEALLAKGPLSDSLALLTKY